MANDYEYTGGAYPSVENFNPGGEDADVLRTIEGKGLHRVDGTGTNGITDHGDEDPDTPTYGDEFPTS